MAYSKEDKESLFSLILLEIENGFAITNICNRDGMPRLGTIYNWLDSDDDMKEAYLRASNVRSERIFEEILTIADKQDKDVYLDKDGREVTDHNVVNRSRLQVDTRKWMLGKMNPRKYGEKLDVTSDGGKVQAIQIIGMKITNDETED
jgi:hypothetical protein